MRKLLVLSLAFFMVYGVNAQIGAKAGVNLSVTRADNVIDTKIAWGMNAGVLYKHKIAPLVFLRAEVLFNQKGYKLENLLDDTPDKKILTNKITLSYLEVPILAEIKLGPLYVNAGPYFGYALGGNITIEGGDNVDIDEDIDFDDIDKSKIDFGICGGLGFQFGISKIHVFTEGRVGLGLTGQDEYAKLMNKSTVTDIDLNKNIVIGISVGVLLGN